jgi:hypothetical protein
LFRTPVAEDLTNLAKHTPQLRLMLLAYTSLSSRSPVSLGAAASGQQRNKLRSRERLRCLRVDRSMNSVDLYLLPEETPLALCLLYVSDV